MTFGEFIASTDQTVQSASRNSSWSASLAKSPLDATWRSGQYTVEAFPIDADVAVVRFFDDGIEALQHENPAWEQTLASSLELCLAISRFFNGTGVTHSLWD